MGTENPAVIITGANNGIGFHLAASLLEEVIRRTRNKGVENCLGPNQSALMFSRPSLPS